MTSAPLTDTAAEKARVDETVACTLRQWLASHGCPVADPEHIETTWLLDAISDVTSLNPHDRRTATGRAWDASMTELARRVHDHIDQAAAAVAEHQGDTP